MFPASKPTTLESSNKSLARPHQSSTSSGSGKGDSHSRPRRSVGHASVSPSVSSMDPSTVDMHELITTPSVSTVSVVHGVASVPPRSTDVTQPEVEGANSAFVSSSVNIPVTTGELIDSATLETTPRNNEPSEETTTNVPSSENLGKSDNITNNFTESVSAVSAKPDVENPPELSPTKNELNVEKDINKIAYEPESMQGDAFPSLYSYGLQKFQYLQLLARLNEANENLHIKLSGSNESVDKDKDLNRLQYVTENIPNKHTEPSASTTQSTTVEPITTVTSTTNKPTTVLSTTNKPTTVTSPTNISTTQESVSTTKLMTTHIPHVLTTTQSTQSVTNPNVVVVNNTITPTEPVIEEDAPATVNIASESRVPDATSNPTHMLINLTISTDDDGSTLYKPLYSLTVTVPTVGDSNEIPTVKITPMDIEPTNPTNFNNPVKIDSSTKSNPPINTEDWGGSCECSCPVCNEDNTTDDFYTDYSDNSTTDSPGSDSTSDSTETSSSIENNSSPNSEIESTVATDMSTETTTDIGSTTTEITDSTIDYTTESDVVSSTVPNCECPKVVCPPILVLEGEVVGFEYDQR